MDKWRTKEVARLVKIYTPDEQYVKVRSLRHMKKDPDMMQDLRDASTPSVDQSAVCETREKKLRSPKYTRT